jgi:exonuclease SbcC
MKPVSLTLRGFIGIKKGMGLDEITLDLSSLSGLIAFDGKNGRGKSTILDSMTPYRRLASRDGSLQHHVFLRDSYKEFTFDFGGHRYRTLVKIDSHSGRQEGFIWKNEEPQVSGKATEYDKYIEDLLGSPKLFFQSVFAAQGGDSIVDMTTGELKGLFTEFLRLDKLAAYEESAKQAGNAIQADIDVIKQRIKNAEQQIADKGNLENDLSLKETGHARKKAKAEECRGKIDRVQAELEKAKDAAAGHRAAEHRKQELIKQKDEFEEQLVEMEKVWNQYDQSTGEKTAALSKQIADKEAALKGRYQVQKLKEELYELDGTLSGKEKELDLGQKEIDFAQADIEDKTKARDAHIASAQADIDEQQRRINELAQDLQETERLINRDEKEIIELERDDELASIENEVHDLRTAISKKKKLPEQCDCHICPFMTEAMMAEKDLPEALGRLEERAEHVKVYLEQNRRAVARRKAKKEETQGLIKQANDRKAQLAADMEEQKKAINSQIEDLAKSRDAAREYVTQLQEEIKKIKRRQAEIRTDIDGMPNYEALESEIKALRERHDELLAEHQRRQDEHWKQKGVIKEKVVDIETAILALPLDYEAEQKVKEKASELESLQATARALEDEIGKLQSEIAVLRHRLEECTKVEERIRIDQEKAEALAKELGEWRYIQQACGKDGLRALEIDGTAPLIAGYANDLLTATFGPGATVGFRTLNDDGKECLDVVVYREDDQDENGTLLENLSGGQKVWILKALRLALTLVAKQKSGKDIAAALSDEEDGALDAENAMAFIGLYRAFMEAGGFGSCLYITHRDVCKQMADHVIRLTDKGIEIDSNSIAEAA